MESIWLWIKGDYTSVTTAWYFVFNGKAPKWVPTVIYMILLPFGIALFPGIFIVRKYKTYRFNRQMKKYLSKTEEV